MDKIKTLMPFALGAVLAVVALVTGINFSDALGILTSADAAQAFCDAREAAAVVKAE